MLQSDDSEPASAPMRHSLWARVLAEFAGSLIICFAIYMMLSLGTAFYGTDMAFVAVGVGVIYAAVTFIFAKISGGQFNPAITVAAMLTSKTRVLDGILYIIAQIIGAICAGGLFAWIIPTSEQVTASAWYTMVINGFGEGSSMASQLSQLGIDFNITMAIIVELVASIIVVATAVVTMKKNGVAKRSHSVAMGIAYAAATAMSFPVTGASINPVRATGIAIFAHGKGLAKEPLTQLWVFWVCAILAAAVVALVIIVSQIIAGSQGNATLADADPAAVALTAAQKPVATQDYQDVAAQDDNVTLTEEEADLASPYGYVAKANETVESYGQQPNTQA
ncbi:MIP/aquaporin family protein [Bifidobacterium gallicum]|uniref:Transporter, major intrinsic protein (MIP) family protein n=2 Tax=Bifidobacterium gallicum DSM 20093 = LMG 11596 TaxID=561180 RepID=D1NTL1_9BIFI|nr:transporter, major intrinsic protein (MIP) family protein [Bifidobacterium gallicum DSM 20093 = LMG 11596]